MMGISKESVRMSIEKYLNIKIMFEHEHTGLFLNIILFEIMDLHVYLKKIIYWREKH